MIKIADHKTLVKLLTKNGFALVKVGKHMHYRNAQGVLAVIPTAHQRKFSRIMAERIAKEVGIL
jgi:predicted RNA binding protein YcfA (HicA-like mRNA interferase family)